MYIKDFHENLYKVIYKFINLYKKKKVFKWGTFCCTVGHYYLCVKFECNNRYHRIQKTVLKGDYLSA